MKTLLLLATAITAGTPPSYRIDLSRYFTDAIAEQTTRATLLAEVDAFVKASPIHIDNPQALYDWLATYQRLLIQLRKHDAYVYLLAERNSENHEDETADAVLSAALDRVNDAVQNVLVVIGPTRLKNWVTESAALAPFKYLIHANLEQAAHIARDKEAIAVVAHPALRALGDAYKSLLTPAATAANGDAKMKFEAKWQPFARNEAAFAAVLLPIVHLRDGTAQLEGYSGAPEAAYADAGLTRGEVDDTLAAIRRRLTQRYLVLATKRLPCTRYVYPARR